MRIKLSPQFLYLSLFFLIACTPSAPTFQGTLPLITESATELPTQIPATSAATDSERVTSTGTIIKTPAPIPTAPAAPATDLQLLEPITVPISVYIVDEPTGNLSSGRSATELEPIFDRAQEIWAPAGINLEIQSIQRLTLPSDVVQSIAGGDFNPFFDGAGRDFSVPDPSLINAFYARDIGGPNGIVPFSARLFFVNDEPSVHHERVTSHEIGHILGLHHTLSDENRLMFPGTNGMNLTEEETIVARYVAQGLLDRVR